MKYKFRFDEEFLGNRLLDLSYEETCLVRVIVNGGHNACIRGYKPDRIVNAIKLVLSDTNVPVVEAPCDCSLEQFCGGGPELKKGYVSDADKGVLVMRNLEEFRSSVVEMAVVPMTSGMITLSRSGETVQYPAKFQLLSTIDGNSDSMKAHSLTSRVEIDYFCKEDTDRTPVSLKDVKACVETDWVQHIGQNVYNFKNQELLTTEMVKFTTEAQSKFEDEIKYNYSNPLKIVKVARSVADMRCHSYIRCSDLEAAMLWHTPQFV